MKHSFEAIQILSPSTTRFCSTDGTPKEALHNLIVKTIIMSQFPAETLLGKVPLVLPDKLSKSPSGLIFEYCGIVRVMSIKILETKVYKEFYIYAIFDFELLIGHPFENLVQKKESHLKGA